MAHVRTSIRNAVADLLFGLHTSGDNVVAGRTYPRSERQLPCLLVLTNDESIEEGAGEDPHLDRSLELVVRCAVLDGADSVDETIDTMVAEVEERMAGVGTLSGLVGGVSAPRSIRTGFDESLQMALAIADIPFQVSYSTRASSPGVAI